MLDTASLPTVVSRRSLIKGLTANAAVIVAGNSVTGGLFAQSAIVPGAAIASDGKVTLQCAHSEMGQGISTTFAAVIADELEADWDRCEVAFSPAAPAYRHPLYDWQFTGNAESIRSYHALIRKMGAAAREMLIAAAADKLGAPPAELAVRKGRICTPPAGARSALVKSPSLQPQGPFRPSRA